jgi:YfiH family protein
MDWREQEGVRWLEAELPGARAHFSARLGGVSDGAFRSLNLGLLTGDEPGAVRENRHRLAGALGIDPRDVLIGRQVHAAEVAWHKDRQPEQAFAEPGPHLDEFDGQATASETLAPLVLVADCLPVALAGPGGVAMAHCGWRGLAKGVIAHGAEAVGATAAAIGPGIGACCYQVGEEVLEAFEGLGPTVAEGRMLDLVEVARRLLAESGVRDIETSGLCTSCNDELFFSHRRDSGHTGRQAGVVRRWSS